MNKEYKWMPFDLLKIYVQRKGIRSATAYNKWVKANNPIGVPFTPHKIYKEWTNWRDFLGTNNEWGDYRSNRAKMFLPYHEAVKYMSQFNLNNITDFRKWYRENKPDRIPYHPSRYYKKLNTNFDWQHFLGNTTISKLDMIESELIILAIVRDSVLPFNVFTFIIKNGRKELTEALKEHNWELIKTFNWNKSKTKESNAIIANCSSAYYGESMTRIVPNIHELIWNLSEVLDII